MRRIVSAIALIAVLVIAYAVNTSSAPTASTPTVTSPSGTAPQGSRGVVDAVLDGDSLRMIVDGTPVEVRMLGINAPERGECWADESRSALTELTTGLTLTVVDAGSDQYGRTLAYLYDGPTNLNLSLVSSGSALALANEHELLPDFLAAEQDAVQLQRGMWAPGACGDAADAGGIGIWAYQPDAPGRDDENPNGEFVTISNDGPDRDMTGWQLRDESSVHRFVFPDGFVLRSRALVTVRSGCGADTTDDLYWCADGSVWTNSGDTVILLDPTGAVIERIRYFGD